MRNPSKQKFSVFTPPNTVIINGKKEKGENNKLDGRKNRSNVREKKNHSLFSFLSIFMLLSKSRIVFSIRKSPIFFGNKVINIIKRKKNLKILLIAMPNEV